MANAYIHPTAPEIQQLVTNLGGPAQSAMDLMAAALDWFDTEQIQYSRLNAPFAPLQRSDLDVVHWHSGTCGDFSNLLVSLLVAAGHPAAYATVQKDCYGDWQDHICAATQVAGRWVLIDATDPYRKFHGLDCPHQAFKLLTPAEMTAKFRQDETTWTAQAAEWDDPCMAGVLYAPWLHNQTVMETEDSVGSIFLLLSLPAVHHWRLDAYYQCYTAVRGFSLIRRVITPASSVYQFSEHSPAHIWDEKQWSLPTPVRNLPKKLVFASEQLDEVLIENKKDLESVVHRAAQ